jgi:hypothetical protein
LARAAGVSVAATGDINGSAIAEAVNKPAQRSQCDFLISKSQAGKVVLLTNDFDVLLEFLAVIASQNC